MNQYITIVSGLPRSGTSLMMEMLKVGGMDILTDNIRKADVDNPRGYYELEKVKKIKDDSSWLKETYGKAFKMISMLLYELPANERYKIIFMLRNIDEMIFSQKKMLKRFNKKPAVKNDKEMRSTFKTHLDKIYKWLDNQQNIDALYISYNDIVMNPLKEVESVNRFLGNILNIDEMIKAVDPSLYRSRVNAQKLMNK